MQEPAPPENQSAREIGTVLVAGAGPAGLTAAYEAVRRGARALVVEMDTIVGGHARTAVHNGYRFDMGGHRFFTKMPRVQAIWDELLGDDMLHVPRLSRIYYNRRFFQYPLQITNVLTGLGLWNSAMMGFSYLYALVFPLPREDNFEQWVINRFGRRLYRTFFKSYTEKVWGIPCDEIGADWAAQRIKGLSMREAIIHSIVGDRSSNAKTLINEFLYPRLGPGMLWERMATAVETGGGEVRMETPVRRILHEDGRVTGFDLGEGDTAVADHYIGSMPLSVAARMMDPPPPDEVVEAANALNHRDFLTVCLVVDTDELFPDNWIYIHDPAVRMGRLQNFRNWSVAMLADPSKTSLGAEFFCSRGDDLWDMDDEELVALTARELRYLDLLGDEEIEDAVVYRRPNAYPVYDGDYRRHLDVLETYFKSFTNMQMVGRSGLHKYNNQDHSMLTAIMAVENLAGAEHDIWAVNSDDEYHEAGSRPS
jgi:protoporphyrinogen oxidase